MLVELPKPRRHVRTYRTIEVPAKPKNKAPRDPNDFYPTPENAINALLTVEQFPGSIWEPACGAGHICKALAAHGWNVDLATDLFDKGGFGESGINFLKSSHIVDHIVTNPPYSIAEAFVQHAIKNTRSKVAMLLQLSFLESGIRKNFFKDHPPARVYVFRDRVSLYSFGHEKQGDDARGGKTAMAWFIWDRSHAGRPTIDWITADLLRREKKPAGKLVDKLMNEGRAF